MMKSGLVTENGLCGAKAWIGSRSDKQRPNETNDFIAIITGPC